MGIVINQGTLCLQYASFKAKQADRACDAVYEGFH